MEMRPLFTDDGRMTTKYGILSSSVHRLSSLDHTINAFMSTTTLITQSHMIFVEMKHICFYCKLFVMGLFLALPAQAQEIGRVGDIETAGTSYHVFARPGEATVQILVLGDGGGIYKIGAETKLDEFLALIGGAPGFGVRTSQSRTSVTIQLYRVEGGRRTLVYEAPMEQMFTEPGQYPRLQDGDVFVVETKERNRIGWRDVLSVVTGISAIVLLVARLSDL